MLMAYLLCSIFFAIVCTIVWLIAGGSWVMALVVYTLSGLLMLAALVSARHFGSRDPKD